MNILTVDVEPWYCDLQMNEWKGRPEYVAPVTRDILDMLDDSGNRATFFVLAGVAERYPDLIEEIVDRGQEVASHGHSHTPVRELTPESFEEELVRSVAALEAAGADEVVGFRAPQFSIDEKSMWALNILRDHGFVYDASVFPVKTPLYGIPYAPRTPYRIDSETLLPGESDLWELPSAATRLPVVGNVPVAGGFYLRALPYSLYRAGLRAAPEPRVCFIHPWDLDPDVPRIPEFGFTHYLNTDSARNKFVKLLADFEFTTAIDYVRNWLEPTERAGAEPTVEPAVLESSPALNQK